MILIVCVCVVAYLPVNSAASGKVAAEDKFFARASRLAYRTAASTARKALEKVPLHVTQFAGQTWPVITYLAWQLRSHPLQATFCPFLYGYFRPAFLGAPERSTHA